MVILLISRFYNTDLNWGFYEVFLCWILISEFKSPSSKNAVHYFGNIFSLLVENPYLKSSLLCGFVKVKSCRRWWLKCQGLILTLTPP